MNQQNTPANTSTSTDLPVKRKRGRPRKDENLVKKETSQPTTPAFDVMRTNYVKVSSTNRTDEDMVGQTVSGVVEGTFDAGYVLSVRVGNSSVPLRGVVFQPGHYTPITEANDVAPHAPMYKRREFSTPVFNQQSQLHVSNTMAQSEPKFMQSAQFMGQAPMVPCQVLPPAQHSSGTSTLPNQSASAMVPLINMPKDDSGASLGNKFTLQKTAECGSENNSGPSLKNLKMVEQDEVMQAYEVSPLLISKVGVEVAANVMSAPGSELIADTLSGSETIPPVQNQMESRFEPRLAQNEMKSPNLKLHQTSVAEPQCLSGEPQSAKSGLEPSESVPIESKSFTPDVHQEPGIVLPQSLSPKPESADSVPKPCELVDNEILGLDPELHQKHDFEKVESVPLELISEPLELISEPMDIVMEKPVSPRYDIPQDMQPGIAMMVSINNESSQNRMPVNDTADCTDAGIESTPRAVEATPSQPDLDAEESCFPGDS